MIHGGDYESWHVFGVVRTIREKMRRTILETRMHPVLSCWCVVATVTIVFAAWQENIRPKMYVQLGECRYVTPYHLSYSPCCVSGGVFCSPANADGSKDDGVAMC